MKSILAVIIVVSSVVGCFVWATSGTQQRQNPEVNLEGAPASIRPYLGLMSTDSAIVDESLSQIQEHWQDDSTLMLTEVSRFLRFRRSGTETLRIREEKTGLALGPNHNAWYRWLWNQEPTAGTDYAEFKTRLYESLDDRFAAYFRKTDNAVIRLDEIVWGGVKRDGIPPLNNPEMISAEEADYLEPDNVVFGVIYNGDVRCYPKRILAWHEMFKDTLGGTRLCGVYCTLCGSLIIYEADHQGTVHDLGTSGFLYRSNKLMYDKATESLWSTLDGEPVVGPLVGKGIRLKQSHVVTTTWGEWSRRHPDTTVLSLNTGHDRDYGEGVAYRRYFSNNSLMFHVPELDGRLPNKAEVLAMKAGDDQLALSAEFLNQNAVYSDTLGDQKIVVLTDGSGASRVYESGDVAFESWDQDTTVKDSSGATWTVSPEQLTSNDRTLVRLPAHRAFWFGWYAQYPTTRLVK